LKSRKLAKDGNEAGIEKSMVENVSANVEASSSSSTRITTVERALVETNIDDSVRESEAVSRQHTLGEFAMNRMWNI